MNIKTESIKELLEISLDKELNDINYDDLNTITYLRINRIDGDNILDVDSSDLELFHNLEEISIENCIIDNKFLTDLEKTKVLNKICFIHCDFVDNVNDYFSNLVTKELVLNDVIGLDGVLLSNIQKITFINCSFGCEINNVNTIDVSLSNEMDFSGFIVKDLIINEKQYLKNNYPKCRIIIKDNYDEVIKVIEND